MIKITKLATSSAIALGMLLTAVVPANADPAPSLTFAQFTETAGYKELEAAGAASLAYIATQSGLVQETNVTLTNQETTVSSSSRVEATKTAIHQTSDILGATSSVWIIDGTAYYAMDSYLNNTYQDYPTDLFTRIPNGESKLVKMATIPDELITLTPESIFSPDKDTTVEQTLAQYAQIMDYFRFSEVTKTVSQDDPTFMDFDFDMAYNLLGSTGTIHEKLTFKSGLMTGSTISTDMGQIGNYLVTTSTQIKNDLVITAPVAENVITEAALTRVINQAAVESFLTTKANSIIKKAGTLAKKAKSKITAKHLASAADALKTKYTKITNGIKISTTISKVKGNLCITAVKGKTSTKTC